VDFPRHSGLIAASEEMTVTRRPCRNHSPAFKAKVAVTAIKGDKTLIELVQDFDVHPNQINRTTSTYLFELLPVSWPRR
jgi:hypothetical protein